MRMGIIMDILDVLEVVDTVGTIVDCADVAKEVLKRRQPKGGIVKLPVNSVSLRKKNCFEVKSDLEELGFTNFEFVKIEDLKTGILTKDGSVESVMINGMTGFKKGAKISVDAVITIAYHTFKQ